MTDTKLMLFNQKLHNLQLHSNSHGSYTEEELERIKHCGNLFPRRSIINKDLLNEFFKKEPCLYNQLIYKNAARIFHCLKADLNENPILKSLKQQRIKELGEEYKENQVTEVPRINYESNQEKRNTLQLAFSTLKFQKVLEDLTEECQFYGNYPEFKDDTSLVTTILFDYMTRKFQLRDKLSEEPFDNNDKLVTQIEIVINREKTDLAAELAKNRIKSDALTLEELLPKELREVEHHKAELPLYCWINTIKISQQNLIQYLIENEDLKLVESKKFLDKKCFMIDPHCSNVIMFHYALRDKILNHELVKTFKLVVQDKSSCLAPHTVLKLLSKKDDVIITNVGGGLAAAFIGCMMDEYEGKVFVYGLNSDEKIQEMSNKLQQIGCLKYVKLQKEEFINAKVDDPKLENSKVILINAPCSKSALMNPMEFLFQEGEEVKFLRDYTLDVNNPSKIKKCIQEELAILRHALKFNRARAIVYQTYSKNNSENDLLINKSLDDFNENKKPTIFPYKISPPVIPLTAEDIQNDEVVKNFKFLQFKPSTKMNGCFIALLTRDKDSKVDKEARKAEALIEKKSKMSTTERASTATRKGSSFQEKNFLLGRDLSPTKKSLSKSTKKLPKRSNTSTIKPNSTYNRIENEIMQLQNEQEKIKDKKFSLGSQPVSQAPFSLENFKAKLLMTNKNLNQSNLDFNQQSKLSSFDRLSQIGKLDAKKIDMELTPNRSSTPDEKQNKLNDPIHLKQFQFKLNK